MGLQGENEQNQIMLEESRFCSSSRGTYQIPLIPKLLLLDGVTLNSPVSEKTFHNMLYYVLKF